MLVLGIDPGLGGAMCLLGTGLAISRVLDMPTFSLSRNGKTKLELDAQAIVRALDDFWPIGHAFIEQVGAMPGQGVSSVFAFGKAYGVLIGLLSARGIPTTFVAPKVWKKALAVPAEKDGARARASQLLPYAAHHWPLKKDHGKAEASLIALWGIRSLNGIARGEAA